MIFLTVISFQQAILFPEHDTPCVDSEDHIYFSKDSNGEDHDGLFWVMSLWRYQV